MFWRISRDYEKSFGSGKGRMIANHSPKFAQSVHLKYKKLGYDFERFQKIKKNGWTLKNTIVVLESVPATFFATIVYGGGYAGVQQLDNKDCNQVEGNYTRLQ